ncbi:MAG: ATPase domain-containing protein [Candidatus Electryoneaceae bacterium]|nr:ATPase domain-containing protein [Candidatus Electryoneaceae bacterium]
MFYAKISSGLDFLDASIGGLYSNRCYLLRGPSHSGRTTMILQFLLSSLEQGENGIMISSDRIENVILRAEAMGFALEQYLMDNKLILMEYPQDIINGNFNYGGIVNLLGEIEQYIQLYNCTRLAVDTLLPLLIRPREPHFCQFLFIP